MDKAITYDFSDNFIEKLAEYIQANLAGAGNDLSRFAFVFGGRRPSLFLSKALSLRFKKAFFPPRFFSIDEFMEYGLLKKHSFSKISDLDACFAVYRLAQKLTPQILKNRQGFSDFLPWARQVISFIEQLDLDAIEPNALLNVQASAKIGYDVPENINTLLENIILIRDAYHKQLQKDSISSRGLVYLSVSKLIGGIDFSEFDRIFFCGFFYLHKTEKAVLDNLCDSGRAGLILQAENKKPSPNIYIQAGFDIHSQVCLVREALGKLGRLDKTAIVLPKPDSLMPLLSEISSVAEDLNVSMGYPLKRSSVYSLFEAIFKAQEDKRADGYYAKDYLMVLTHPLVKNLKILKEPAGARILAHTIEELITGKYESPLAGSLFVKLEGLEGMDLLYGLVPEKLKQAGIEVDRERLKSALEFIHNILFKAWEEIKNFRGFVSALDGLLGLVLEKGPLAGYPVNLKMTEAVFSIRDELIAGSFNEEPFSKSDIFKIFSNKLDNEIISFSGSPLRGLQVLGFFETRSLSFENVIITDVNEGALPFLKNYEPLIPREVMINLGLNRLKDEEEIQRYHFKRLISCAKNVYLIYQETDEAQKSRFLEEIIWNAQKEAVSLEALKIKRAHFDISVLPKGLEVKKAPGVIDFLKGHRYSASSVNTYLHCPLRFYCHYVLGLREKEGLFDEPQAVDIGVFVHELLNEAYAGFAGRRPRIDREFRKYFMAVFQARFEDKFEKKMRQDSFLIREVLEFRLERFLDAEADRDVREILCLEKSYEGAITLKGGEYKIKAVVDRIDLLEDGSALVIDYKTGSTDIMPARKIERIKASGLERRALKQTIKSFQLPLYIYAVKNYERPKAEFINAALYSIKQPEGKHGLRRLFSTEEQIERQQALMDIYMDALDCLLAEIVNPDAPFAADTEDPEGQCSNCPFFYMCR